MSIPSPASDSPSDRSNPAEAGELAVSGETIKRLRHDLRTPLNQMIGYSEMLIESISESGPPELLDDLRRLCSAAGDLLTVLNDALAQWKVEAGKVDLAGLRRNLHGPLNAFVGYRDLCEEAARLKGRGEIISDLQKIEQATGNLRQLLKTGAFADREVIAAPTAAPGPPPAASTVTVAPFAGSQSPGGVG